MSPVARRRLLLYTLGAVATGAAGTIGVSEWRAHRRRAITSAGGPGVAPPADAAPPRRRLGRTGLEVSVVSIGGGGLEGIAPIARAVDRGMNYIDTSTCYGGSENVIGRALRADPSMRQKLVVATKWDPGPATKKEEMLESLDSSLRRLGVDVIDVMQVHWLGGGHIRPDDGFNRLDNPELYEAMAIAKKAGKVRFFGATSHDANRAKILAHAIDRGFDVLLVKMNVLDFETAGIPELLAKAKARDVGVVAMKSQPEGGKIPSGFEKSRLNVYQANLRWCLEQDVATVVHSSIGVDASAQDLAIAASLEKLGARDAELLDRYASALSPDYCRGCGDVCGAACPEKVAIAPVLQFGMYAREYGWTEHARELYRALPEVERWSSACASCDLCSRACPYGVDAAGRVNDARTRLG